MKKLILILACASICVVGCKQKSSKTETEVQNQQTDLENDDSEDLLICQSCGMPMTEDLYGTNADSSSNHENCIYCYKDGAYTAPDITMNEMLDICVSNLVEQGFDKAEAVAMMEEILPTLDRWSVEE
jgi:hypothetical protein